MKLGTRTSKLVREAIVLGYAAGANSGVCKESWDAMMADYPKDSEVVKRVLRDAQAFSDLYPTLAKVENL